MSNILFGSQSPGMTMLMYIVFIGAMLYFFLIRPQKKQMNERKNMLEALKVGTRIATAGGLVGYVRAVTDDRVFIEPAEGLILEFQKQAVAMILDHEDDADDSDDDDHDSLQEESVEEAVEEAPVEEVEEETPAKEAKKEVDPDFGCIREDNETK